MTVDRAIPYVMNSLNDIAEVFGLHSSGHFCAKPLLWECGFAERACEAPRVPAASRPFHRIPECPPDVFVEREHKGQSVFLYSLDGAKRHFLQTLKGF